MSLVLDTQGSQPLGTIVGAILLLVGLSVVIGIFIYFATTAEELGKETVCHNSLRWAAYSKYTNPLEQKPKVPIKCKRNSFVIEREDVVVGGVMDQEKAGYILADRMHRCKRMVFGDGSYDSFSNYEEKESYCLLCDVLEFDDSLNDYTKEHAKDVLPDGSNIKDYYINSPALYMASHTIPKGEDKGKTYWETIYQEEAPPFTQQDVENVERSILLPHTVIIASVNKQIGIEGKKENALWAAGTFAATAVLAFVIPPLGLPALVAEIVAATGTGVWAYAAAGDYGGSIWSNCEDCAGVPGIFLIPQDQAFTDLAEFTYTDETGKTQTKKAPLCTQLVN